jgi:hypothetical protein
MSTVSTTEVVGYPDSGKVAAMAVENAASTAPWVRGIYKTDAQVDYYDGERID